MADQISFESEGPGAPYAAAPQINQVPSLVRLVMRLGLAGNERVAKYILLGVAVCILLAAVAVPSLLGPSAGTNLPHAGNTSTYTGPVSR